MSKEGFQARKVKRADNEYYTPTEAREKIERFQRSDGGAAKFIGYCIMGINKKRKELELPTCFLPRDDEIISSLAEDLLRKIYNPTGPKDRRRLPRDGVALSTWIRETAYSMEGHRLSKKLRESRRNHLLLITGGKDGSEDAAVWASGQLFAEDKLDSDRQEEEDQEESQAADREALLAKIKGRLVINRVEKKIITLTVSMLRQCLTRRRFIIPQDAQADFLAAIAAQAKCSYDEAEQVYRAMMLVKGMLSELKS